MKKSKQESVENEQVRVFSENEILAYIQTQKSLTVADIASQNRWVTGEHNRTFQSMNTYERAFAKILIKKGLKVYREIPIADNGSTADFYVYNPRSKRGKLVEVTLLQKEYKKGDKKPSIKTIRRKDRQIETLEATGMTYVVLYKENFRAIRKTVTNLF